MPSPESLSPRLSSIESLKASLPEKHRHLFDALLQDIKDYCEAHGLPVPSNLSPEIFTKAVTTRHTPPEVLKHLVLLLTRFDYLTEHKKPMPPEQDPAFQEVLKYVEERYHLREQYDAQMTLLHELGIIRKNAIDGLKHWQYPVPSFEKIAFRLFRERKALAPKYDQGFTKLILVPFGMSLDDLFQAFRRFLLAYKRSHPVMCIDAKNPLSISDAYKHGDKNENLLYYPPSFHGNIYPDGSKPNILQKQISEGPPETPGWQVHLFQPSDPWNPFSKGIVPLRRLSERKMYGIDPERVDFEPGKSPEDYLIDLSDEEKNPEHPYHLESGLSPEDWMMACITHLTETGKILDQAMTTQEAFGVHLLGALFDSEWKVPAVYPARRGIIQFGTAAINKPVPHHVIRTSVRI
jgi:hypothetical protein